MSIIALGFGLLIGMMIGRFFRNDENCPRRVLEYSCKGFTCDHRKSVLYANMSAMALNDEERAPNIPGGF